MNEIEVDVVVLGTGLSAAGVDLALTENAHIKSLFLQKKTPSYLKYSQVTNRSGMSKFWHMGCMRPSSDVLRFHGIDDASLVEFASKHEIKCLGKCFMDILPAARRSEFTVSGDNVLLYDKIEIIVGKDSSRHEVRVDGLKSIFTPRIFYCLSTLGNFDNLLNYTKNLNFEFKREYSFGDHIMHASKPQYISENKTLLSESWEEADDRIFQKRQCFFPSKINFNRRVELLTIKIIGRLLYGIITPSLLINVLFSKLKRRYSYDFSLITPSEPTHQFKRNDSNYSLFSKKPEAGTCYAFHPVGFGDIKLLFKLKKQNLYLFSGNLLPCDYKYFPSFAIYFLSYRLALDALRKSQCER